MTLGNKTKQNILNTQNNKTKNIHYKNTLQKQTKHYTTTLAPGRYLWLHLLLLLLLFSQRAIPIHGKKNEEMGRALINGRGLNLEPLHCTAVKQLAAGKSSAAIYALFVHFEIALCFGLFIFQDPMQKDTTNTVIYLSPKELDGEGRILCSYDKVCSIPSVGH